MYNKSKTTKKNIDRSRIAVYRSNQHIYVQIIDDVKGVTLVSVSDQEIVDAKAAKTEMGKMEKAQKVGELLAQKAKKQNILKVYFDRRQYRYHGRIKALADAARKGGLEF